MALNISAITDLPDPPLKTDPANFAERADTFLDALPDFVDELNAAIAELNTITSGLDQTEPIAAYAAGTTYDFPDVVAGSDGYTYRCVGTSVTGQNPVTDDGTYWVRIGTPMASEAEALAGTEDNKATSPATALAMIRAMALPAPPSGVDVTGNMYGFNLSKTDTNEVTVSAGSCLDSTLSVELELSTATAVAIPSVANTIYHIFVVKLVSDGTMSVRAYTTEAGVASDSAVDKWRWVGWWRTNGSSECVAMTNMGEYYLGNNANDWVVSTAISTTYATVSHSAFIPESRVELIEYGTRDATENGYSVLASDNGTNVSFVVGSYAGSTDPNGGSAWGHPSSHITSFRPYLASRQFKNNNSGTVDLLIHAVKVRR